MWTSVSHHLISYARYMSHFIFPTWATLFVYIFPPVWATVSTHLNFPTLVTRFAPLLFSMRAHLIFTLFPCLLSPLSALYSTLLTPRVWTKRFAYFFSFVWPSWRHSYLEKLKGHGVTCSVILCKLLSLPPFLSPNIFSLAPYFQNSLSCLTKRDQLSPSYKNRRNFKWKCIKTMAPQSSSSVSQGARINGVYSSVIMAILVHP